MFDIIMFSLGTIVLGFFAVAFFAGAFQKVDENNSSDILSSLPYDFFLLEIIVHIILFICKKVFSKEMFHIAYRIVMFSLSVIFTVLVIGIWFIL